MLSSKEYQTLYGTLKKYISTLFENRLFYGSDENREAIADAVKDEVPLFLFLAEQVGSSDEANLILSKFKEIFFVIEEWDEKSQEDFGEKEFEEIKSDVNYLKVCVRNICDVDLDVDDAKTFQNKELSSTLQDFRDEMEAAAKKRQGEEELQADSLVVYKNAFNEDIELDPTIGKDLGEFVLRSHAYERLNKDIRNGSIYIYTSKPRINVIIKYCLLALSSVGLFLSIFIVFSIFKGAFSFGKSIYYLLPILSVVYFAGNIYMLNKHLKNDNFKYSFDKREFIHNTIFTLSMFIFFVPTIGRNPFKLSSLEDDLTSYWSIVSILVLTLVMELIHIISYFVFQPKKDKALIEEVLNRHMSDISNSKGASL